ncbi:sigma-70 family RNA polymerase sigma factor [Akkermansia sp. N21116]|uniref:RNA polymerase sigma factor n=1 Tax=Akkermansia sp. N21116 TaxID=3040764 RepID=UPI00244EB3C7|nr:sigma-70 family RNA polymerase sigma factor [Akkermansia sp. N21116]WPX40055.1 sigma-70 family RNA polymerase sigma factor [Akkermansia sp. N21116]
MSDEQESLTEDNLDAHLMLRIRGGDSQAMEELIRRHQNSVYATVASMLRHGGDVEDIAQQVFIRIWKGAATYEPSSKFTTWMYTIVRNLVFNELRRQKRKPVLSADAIEEEHGQILSIDTAPSPDSSLEHKELTQAVEDAIASLPEQASLAIQLRRYENLSYEEISQVLGISVSATKSLLFRARNTLKEQLSGFLGQ